MEWQKGEYTISTDFARLDLALVHHHLSHEAYWSAGIPLEVVARAFQNSLAFGIYRGEEQVGWARLVTDRATFAYLADVYILEAHRGAGLGKWLMEVILAHPELQACDAGCWLPATPTACMPALVSGPWRPPSASWSGIFPMCTKNRYDGWLEVGR